MSWEFEDNRPIYTQLLEQIEYKIVSGEYELGSKLPSVRDLAAEASVNPNTMQRALTELEREGLVITQRTAGRFITEDMEKVREIKLNMAFNQTSDYVNKMKLLGFGADELIEFIKRNQNQDERK
ncbi:MAG: GntR family transcriptional regulator [Eubacterium sp.]